MQGYVLAYRPAAREGTLVTEGGRAVRFTLPQDSVSMDLRGGDWIVVEPPGQSALIDAPAVAGNLQRPSQPPNDTALRELFAAFGIAPPA